VLKAGPEPVLCLRNQTRGAVFCARVIRASGIKGRSRGLLGRDKLDCDEGMLFEATGFIPVMWMHTFFMRFTIDIVFLDRQGRVIKVQTFLKPWRFSAIVPGARMAIELAAGAASRTQTAAGDLIVLEEIRP
jgi:uncharacterized membrane protein (UPF0127 family)